MNVITDALELEPQSDTPKKERSSWAEPESRTAEIQSTFCTC